MLYNKMREICISFIEIDRIYNNYVVLSYM